jgi:hypothetical protein
MDEWLTIVVEVTGNRLTEDPLEVANDIVADAVDRGELYADERKVKLVGAEWSARP